MGKCESRWIAEDGTEFKVEQDMLLHELSIIDAKEIDLFLMAQNVPLRRLNEYKKLLKAWQAYIRNTQTQPDIKKSNPKDSVVGPSIEAIFTRQEEEDEEFWRHAESLR
jgi:hypothetical protein